VKKYFLFLASFLLLFSFYFFQNVHAAEAFIAEGDPCGEGVNDCSELTQYGCGSNSGYCCEGVGPNDQPLYTTCQGIERQMCNPNKDSCQQVGSTPGNFRCEASPKNSCGVSITNPGPGSSLTTLTCTCQSQGKTATYTCINPKTGQKATGKNGQTVDSCINGQVCQSAPGSIRPLDPNKDQDITIFDLTKYKISGVTCSTEKDTGTCSCDPTDPTKIDCTDNQTKAKASTTCGQGLVCNTTSGKPVDRSQLQNNSILPNAALEGTTCIKANATCTCDNPNQDGSITCTLNGKKATTSCSKNGVCQTDKNATLNADDINPAPAGYNQVTMTGVQCTADQISPTLPPPPSPPCKTWIDGECTSFASGLGAIATDPAGFIQTIFAILLSVSGGIALLLIIRAGYQLLTSQGKPEQLQNGRDQLIAAIVGLIFLIFSFVFLQLIGVDILHLPGFTATTNTPTTCNPSQCVPATTCQTINRGTGGTNCTPNGCPNGEECIP